jgi:hypothetical protein
MYILYPTYKDKIQNSRVPERITSSLLRYIEEGIPPGDFLTAFLENNLSKALGHADDEMRYLLYDLHVLIYNYVPTIAHGSPKIVKCWLNNFDELWNWKGYDNYLKLLEESNV